jgi:hypothetical protein
MNKVTYIIGAGASAEALPLVKSNPDLKLKGYPMLLGELEINS